MMTQYSNCDVIYNLHKKGGTAMPIPFILGVAAAAAGAYGVKKEWMLIPI